MLTLTVVCNEDERSASWMRNADHR